MQELSHKNIVPINRQVLVQKQDKMTKAGIVLTDKKHKFIKGLVKKVGSKCTYVKENEVVLVNKSKTQLISFDDDYFLVEEVDIDIIDYDEQYDSL